MLPRDRQALIWTIVAVVIAILVSLAAYYAYLQYLQGNLMNQFTQPSNRTCADVGEINYRETVYFPNTNGVYEKRLATALLDVAINTTKSNCASVLPLMNPPGFTSQLRLECPEPYSGQKTFFGYIFWNSSGEAIIAFTGTATKAVSQANLQYQQIRPMELNGYEDGIKCHEGFWGIYLNLRPQILEWWIEHQPNIHTAYITGHSLGGALSTLCSFDLAQSNLRIVHYTFGAPRVGNIAFAERFMDRVPTTIRVNNTEDLVPQLPPTRLYDNVYYHTGGNIPFTVPYDTLTQQHIDAYVDHLPEEAMVAKSYIDSSSS